MRNTWEFFSTERILFGCGAIEKLDQVLKRIDAKNVLIITDKGIKRAGILNSVLNRLEESEYNVVVYDRTVSEPPTNAAIECYEFSKSELQIDVIIGLGGGSCIDLAKVVALLLAHGGKPCDYFGENKVPGPIFPLVAIPTTAGTGTEVTSIAVLTDVENNIKVGISDNYLRPSVALLDPLLTLNLPPYVTACSGIDALAHAIEAYTSKKYEYIQAEDPILFQGASPLSDILAFKAIELIAQNLTKAVQQGSNLEARSNMLLGSLLAGMAFSNSGTAAAHALAYPIGGLVQSPHGEITGLLLSYVLRFNAEVEEKKIAQLAPIFQIDSTKMSDKETVRLIIESIFELLNSIGLPSKLSQIGIKKEQIEEIADKALSIDRIIRNNPRVPTRDAFLELLHKAF